MTSVYEFNGCLRVIDGEEAGETRRTERLLCLGGSRVILIMTLGNDSIAGDLFPRSVICYEEWTFQDVPPF